MSPAGTAIIKFRRLFNIGIFFACLLAFMWPILVKAEQARPVIVAGSEIDFPPYAIVDAKGRASGFSVELLEAVAETMGLTVKVNTGKWSDVLSAFKAGKYDLLPLFALSPQRADMATYTRPHTVAFDCFFVRRGSKPVSSIAEAKDREVIVMSSDAAHEALLHSNVPVRIVETGTITEAMRLLAFGKHDAVLVPKLLGLQVLREAKLEAVIEAGRPLDDYTREFAFAVTRGNLALRDKLEQGMAILRSTGKYDELYNKWFSGIETRRKSLQTIVLDSYYPYSYLDDKGEPSGFSLDIARAVAKAMDIKLEMRAERWDLAMKALETGRIDLIPMMAYSVERDKIFDFTVPYTVAYDAIFFRKGTTGIRSLNDLSGKTVMVTQNDAAHSYLLASGLSKTMTINLANSLTDALQLLSAGKGDAVIMPKLIGIETLKRLKISGIETSPQLVDAYNRSWCFAVRNGNQALQERLNQGLRIIKSTGEYDAIRNKWLGDIEGSRLRLKYIWLAGFFVSLIIAGTVFWNMLLKQQVKAKTVKLEEVIIELNTSGAELRQAQAILQTAMDVSPVGIAIADAPDGKLRYVNDAGLLIRGGNRQSVVNGVGIDQYVASWQLLDLDGRVLGADEVPLARAIIYGEPSSRDFIIRRTEGDDRIVAANAAPIKDETGKVTAGIVIFTDITERKMADDQIRASLREKEILLKEIHHRVKNNLQIIASLLKLQNRFSPDEKLKSVFQECQDRIRAMASVHSMLYRSRNFNLINFGDCLRETTAELLRTYQKSPARIFADIRAEEVMLSIDEAIPCSLIINELVTNAAKHAFTETGQGEITIELAETEEGIRLLVKDNGVGFPPELNFREAETLGLQLVTMLVKQLDGTIEQSVSGGTAYTLQFGKKHDSREALHAGQ